MKKSRFTESQIISILKEADVGMKVDDICRKHGIGNATYYVWKSKYGGMEGNPPYISVKIIEIVMSTHHSFLFFFTHAHIFS